MELDNSATSFIIIILTIVTVAYVVYTNYNDILDIKSKLQKLLEVPAQEQDEENVNVEAFEEDCLLSKEWEKDIPLFLPTIQEETEYIQLEEIFEEVLPVVPEEVPTIFEAVEVLPTIPEAVEVLPLVAEESVEVIVEKPTKTVSVRRRKTKQ